MNKPQSTVDNKKIPNLPIRKRFFLSRKSQKTTA